MMKKLKSKLHYKFQSDCSSTTSINRKGNQPWEYYPSTNRSSESSTMKLDNVKGFKFPKLRFFDHLFSNNKDSSPDDESFYQRKLTKARSKSDNELHRLPKYRFSSSLNHSRAGSVELLLDQKAPECLPTSVNRHLVGRCVTTAKSVAIGRPLKDLGSLSFDPLCRQLVYPELKTYSMHNPSFTAHPEDGNLTAGWCTLRQAFNPASSEFDVADDAETCTGTCAVFHELSFEDESKRTSLWCAVKSRSSPGTPNLKSPINRPCSTGYTHFSASFTLTFVGAIEVRTSMKHLDPSMRSELIKECIRRVCEAAEVKPAGPKRKVQKKMSSILYNTPQTPYSNKQAILTIESFTVQLLTLPSRHVFVCHDITDVSYLCTGDTETSEFIAFVARDVRQRLCYVLRCRDSREARLIISSLSHAFDLRFRQNMKRTYRSGPDLNLL